jgi:hypothetical protein
MRKKIMSMNLVAIIIEVMHPPTRRNLLMLEIPMEVKVIMVEIIVES